MKMKERFKYSVLWDGEESRYMQDFDTLEEARAALRYHRSRNSSLKININRDYE